MTGRPAYCLAALAGGQGLELALGADFGIGFVVDDYEIVLELAARGPVLKLGAWEPLPADESRLRDIFVRVAVPRDVADEGMIVGRADGVADGVGGVDVFGAF